MSVNLERYKVFYYTAKYMSFSSAAENLYISQSAVSQSIKQLEKELEGKLFLRTGPGIKLTAEGEVLYKYIEQAYSLIVAGEKKLNSIHELKSGELKIGAGDTICKHYLLEYLQKFHAEYPEVKIQVTNRTTDEITELLKKGEVDIGVINLPYRDDNLEIEKVLEIQDCFVAGEKYKAAAEKDLSMKDLIQYPLLLLEEKANTRRYIDKITIENGIILKPEIELGSIDLLVEFAKIGLGIAFVIENFVENEIDDGELYKLSFSENIPPRSIGVASLKGIPIAKAGEIFLSMLI
ncbi:MAG: LysR family transcriptional regulator [Halanaerobiales bacterium]